MHVTVLPVSAVVDQAEDFGMAMMRSGPQTKKYYVPRHVDELYRPVSGSCEQGDFVLCKFDRGKHLWNQAQKFAKGFGYVCSNPREAFAVVDQNPNLRGVIEPSWLYVVATTPVSFAGRQQAIYVRIQASSRSVGFGKLSYFNDGVGWFLFKNQTK